MMKKKILLFGATGMAGHLIYLKLKEIGIYEIVSVVYRNKLTTNCLVLDVTRKDEVLALVRRERPDYIINAVGVLIKNSLEHPDNAIFLNAYFPHLLARVSDEVGAKLIHISTDCVFSGKKGSYAENDLRDADDIYGKSKGLGEVITKNHLTLRTSIIGPEIKSEGEGLFHWFMNQRGSINGFVNAFWSGITTLQLSKAIILVLQKNLCGLIHVTNGIKISKYDLLKLFIELWKREDLSLEVFEGKFVDKSLKVSTQFNFKIPGYKDMLIEQRAWMEAHEDLYGYQYLR